MDLNFLRFSGAPQGVVNFGIGTLVHSRNLNNRSAQFSHGTRFAWLECSGGPIDLLSGWS
jgi:hypothetical protein